MIKTIIAESEKARLKKKKKKPEKELSPKQELNNLMWGPIPTKKLTSEMNAKDLKQKKPMLFKLQS